MTNEINQDKLNIAGISVMWLIIVLTIIGNVATLLVILTKKSLRDRPDARFLVSLSCADLAVGMFVMTPYVLKMMVRWKVSQQINDIFS